ncbi:MAG: hypothetical protein OEU36_10000, partial [Gammaproteobacteria bacterium]|nr:hypothetical protein [Gammaproteobacteria bacterium]
MLACTLELTPDALRANLSVETNVVVDSSFAGAQEIVDLEERSWLPRYCRGDAVAFTQLMVAYRKTVYSYLVRCGLNKETRDDVFQEV